MGTDVVASHKIQLSFVVFPVVNTFYTFLFCFLVWFYGFAQGWDILIYTLIFSIAAPVYTFCKRKPVLWMKGIKSLGGMERGTLKNDFKRKFLLYFCLFKPLFLHDYSGCQIKRWSFTPYKNCYGQNFTVFVRIKSPTSQGGEIQA